MREIRLLRMAQSDWLKRNCDGLSVALWDVLEAALERVDEGLPPMTMGEATAALGLACSTMTDTVDRLEAKGLARRERDASDRRVIRLVLVDPAKARTVRDCMAEAMDLPKQVAQRLRTATTNLYDPLLMPAAGQ